MTPGPSTPLRDALERAPLPDGRGAETRAWSLLADAYASRPAPAAPRYRRRGKVLALALVGVLLAAAVAVAAQPPHWVRQVLGDAPSKPPAPRSSLGPLPAGRMLVSSSAGTWIVRGDGTRVRLGPWTGATWSPRGLYVGAWRGRSLSAVAPDGRIAWTLTARGTVRDATWSPDGYRIAYRRDDVLAIVAGDGTGARILARPVRQVAPAWRPGAPHTLAWVGAGGRVEVRDVDTGALIWRSAASVGAVRALSWSADGRRLAARGAHRLVLLDVHGNRVRRVRLPAHATVTSSAWAPRGARLALALRERGVAGVLVTSSARLPRRAAFSLKGTLGSLAWSPDGRRLLVRWSEADQWLLLPAGSARTGAAAGARVTAIAGISRRFGAAPAVRSWCCA